MVQLEDYSGLRAQEKVQVPLNGVRYHCVAEVAADLILGLGSSTDIDAMPELPAGVTLDDLATGDPATAMKLERAGSHRLLQMMDFLRDVMEPESHEQWLANMKMPAKGITPAQRAKHLGRMISLPQMTAVFGALMRHYSGRPTKPSPSSPNGDGGTGTDSTETSPAEA